MNENGGDSIKWGWLGKAVAVVVLAGIPAMLIAQIRSEARTELLLDAAERRANASERRADAMEARVRALEDWKLWMDQREQRRRSR